MIGDEAIVRALRARGVREAGSEWAYVIDDVRPTAGEVDVRVHQLSGAQVRVKLPLPSSGRPQPWLYAEAEDADDWVGQLGIWIDEEVLTGGLGWAAKTRIRGADYVTVEPYGWRMADPAEHQRRLDVFAPLTLRQRLANLQSLCRGIRPFRKWFFVDRR